MKAFVDSNMCTQSNKCNNKCLANKVCTTKAIFQLDPGETAVVELAYCNGCGLCMNECPVKAITMKNT